MTGVQTCALPIFDVPLGIAGRDMPTGLQVVGNTFDDLAVFRFAAHWAKPPALYAGTLFPAFTSQP